MQNKRVCIRIDEQTEHALNVLSDFYDVSKSEIIRILIHRDIINIYEAVKDSEEKENE